MASPLVRSLLIEAADIHEAMNVAALSGLNLSVEAIAAVWVRPQLAPLGNDGLATRR
jgi:hypothetical protein